MSETQTSPAFVPVAYYQDPKGALAFLERAFGFETSMLIEGPDGDDSHIHAEMRFGDGLVHVAGEWSERTRSPRSLGGSNTQVTHVKVDGDIDAHCARARSAGSVILEEPADQFYGHRTYQAQDPEGHVWTFHQTVKHLSLDEMAAAGGVTIRTSL